MGQRKVSTTSTGFPSTLSILSLRTTGISNIQFLMIEPMVECKYRSWRSVDLHRSFSEGEIEKVEGYLAREVRLGGDLPNEHPYKTDLLNLTLMAFHFTHIES